MEKTEIEIVTQHYGNATIFIGSELLIQEVEDRISSLEAFRAISSISKSFANKVSDGDSVFKLTDKQLKQFCKALKIE